MTHPIHEIFARAKAELGNDLLELSARIHEHKDKPIGTFIRTACEWYLDAHKSQYLWEMFHEVMGTQGVTFMADLESFVGNYLLDDSYFAIEWRIVDAHSWMDGGEIKYVQAGPENPRSMPVVIRAPDDNGTQSVDYLLAAMKVKVEREQARIAEIEKEMGEIDK